MTVQKHKFSVLTTKLLHLMLNAWLIALKAIATFASDSRISSTYQEVKDSQSQK
ncbi:hypothetical protein [Legionella oakridgensis]|uniref:Uncharacterized protein n=2 Tax=Legionella oakridgensis TaxID=29423 RepID=W0BEX9_9GAMM|nr:hypothetical protein [Legionella oakridgensis]AHE66979.1 hypothetical protein Loa_01426 [Legionella oakridgensis ATCC 33761 = DSM 21215]ETO93340.1 hypothetical protein LOR_45c07430 [Legionella oakridgensis RV-2-2007]KTD38365.1 hypothetical protein Loak_1310 [Legionella oakridgensis]STY20081.1 Uncharacterised protein [Legionella longbeachae]